MKKYLRKDIVQLLFTPVSITTLIGTEDARFVLNGISPIARGDSKWRDALLVTGTVNSNKIADSIKKDKIDKWRDNPYNDK